MAYAVRIDPRCSVCGARATLVVFNDRNAEVGRFCARCSRRALGEREGK